jgi:hypothetical protein
VRLLELLAKRWIGGFRPLESSSHAGATSLSRCGGRGESRTGRANNIASSYHGRALTGLQPQGKVGFPGGFGRDGSGCGERDDVLPMLRPGTAALRRWEGATAVRAIAACLWLLVQCTSGAAGSASNRYLLVVETSASMQARGPATLEAVSDLVSSGMKGQMRAGDSLGLWTFTDTLHTGEFPLQQWTPDTAKSIAQRIVSFLASQSFHNPGALKAVMPALQSIAAKSEFITTVLVSSGDQEISGTGFDAAINQTFKAWQEQQQKAQMPFVTILQAHKGGFTAFRCTALPWPIEFPARPAELMTSRPAPLSLVATNARKPPGPAPLIISGKKSEAAESREKAPSPTQDPASVPVAREASTNPGSRSFAQGPAIAEPPSGDKPQSVRPGADVTPTSTAGSSVVQTNPAPIARALPDVPQNKQAEQGIFTKQPARLTEQPPPSTEVPVLQDRNASKSETLLSAAPTTAAGKGSSLGKKASVAEPGLAAATPAEPFLQRTTTRLLFLGAAAFAFGCLLLLFFRKPTIEQRGSLITRSLDKEQK